ncbi:MAG: glutathione peroxidase [Spirochaetia bacterium]|jgi:glutathione peroxidase|nr:glutathione peroxidase [Spirochaetia bacterium]
MVESLYDQKAMLNNGEEIELSQYKGKVLLIVNTASKCGFTPHYEGLEALHKKYAEQGLVVLGFPCDQFGHQEPGDDEEIATFCQRNFGVTFPLMAKVKVNGKGADPIFVMLRKKARGAISNTIKWNFTKFLVSRDGEHIKRYASTVEPASLESDILKALGS